MLKNAIDYLRLWKKYIIQILTVWNSRRLEMNLGVSNHLVLKQKAIAYILICYRFLFYSKD